MTFPLDAQAATERVRSHPDFLPRLREHVQMARDGSLFAGAALSVEDIEAMRAEVLQMWEPELALLEQRRLRGR